MYMLDQTINFVYVNGFVVIFEWKYSVFYPCKFGSDCMGIAQFYLTILLMLKA